MPDMPNQNKLCDVFCYNKEKVGRTKDSLPNDDTVCDLAGIFKVISEKSRIKILLALKQSELCVCDISHVLGISISAVSHQLRVLRDLKLVRYRNEGKIVFYSPAEERIIDLLEQGMEFIR